MAVLLLTLHHVYYTANCGEEGDVRLDPKDGGEISYRLLQVCLLENWTYVCQGGFDHKQLGIDRNVVLQQLQCSAGGKVVRSLLHVLALLFQ